MNKKEKVLQEIQNCKSKEELMKVFEDNKIELNEEDLKKVNGGEWIDIVKKIANSSSNKHAIYGSVLDSLNEDNDNLGNPS